MAMKQQVNAKGQKKKAPVKSKTTGISNPTTKKTIKKTSNATNKAKPNAAKTKTATSSKKATMIKKRLNNSVLYVGHIPNGFFEPQIKAFFSQFGNVLKIRLMRSKKSAHSKGYAFIQFEMPEIAKIVSETIHQYRIFGRTLVCKVLPPEQVGPKLFLHSEKRFKYLPRHSEASKKHDIANIDTDLSVKRAKQLIDKRNKKIEALKVLGIDLYGQEDNDASDKTGATEKTSAVEKNNDTDISDKNKKKKTTVEEKKDSKGTTSRKVPAKQTVTDSTTKKESTEKVADKQTTDTAESSKRGSTKKPVVERRASSRLLALKESKSTEK